MSTIIKRNTPIPCKKVHSYTTNADNQTVVRIDVLEGERTRKEDNELLGTFHLTGLPPLPKGEAKIDVTLDINADGILLVSAQDKSNGLIRLQITWAD